jgi:hypothetical protein
MRDRTRHEAGALSVRLSYRPPYDWDAMLSFLSARAIPGVESVEDGVYRRTIRLEGALFLNTECHEPWCVDVAKGADLARVLNS